MTISQQTLLSLIILISADYSLVHAGFGKLLPSYNTEFYLVKKGEDPSLSYTLINKNNVSATPGWSLIKPQNKTLPLALVIHGMGGTYNSSSNYLIGKALLDNYKDINLVSVDYSKDIETDYLTAVGKVFPVAQKVADWLTELINDGELSPEELTLIGFSLGAHVAGITGKILRSSNFTVGKIIALDPALPAFESATEDERLAKNDADYVMVLHTTGGNIAFSDPLGDIDFYPNGGTDPQPMCFTSRLSSMMCSHSASYRYLAEAIESGGFEAIRCDSWQEYEEGKCNENDKVYMNINVNKSAEGKYYLKTRSKPPFGDPLLGENEVEKEEENLIVDGTQNGAITIFSYIYVSYISATIITLLLS